MEMRMFPDCDIRIVIVGGGATGVLLACHLLRDPERRITVTVIEKSEHAGLGLAYATRDPQHLLNVRASNMSAFPDRPEHFWNWVTANKLHGELSCSDAMCFVPRQIYGRYIASLLRDHRAGCSSRQGLHVVRGECTALRPVPHGVEVSLADGTRHVADIAVLATGNEAPPAAYGACGASPWREPQDAGVKPDDAVLILGSGLTMVDYVISLLQAGHHGPITAMSRRGLLPMPHRVVTPLKLDAADVPFGSDISYFLHWLRRTVDGGGRNTGQDWRAVVDALRPFTAEIWQSWPDAARRRFLRHARAWWDVHRHRTAPEIDARLRAAIASDAVKVLAAKVAAVAVGRDGATVSYRRRGQAQVESMRVAKIVACVGVGVPPHDSANPVLQDLLRQGLIRPDPLGIGLDVTADCAVIGRNGKASDRILALGPLTRGRFWEITAIPDIRLQCAALARRILHGVHAAAE
jgi:uncharacterized NAD(P)/FAD-binding protein YdhS